MTTANQVYKTAKDYGEELSEDVGDFARDVSKRAKKGASRAGDIARDAYDEAHEASKDYPHVALAIAAGLGFLLGILAASRR
jgi:ElaB/YqjD/DUF883 family membrane-anchored ribosome-binding protein